MIGLAFPVDLQALPPGTPPRSQHGCLHVLVPDDDAGRSLNTVTAAVYGPSTMTVFDRNSEMTHPTGMCAGRSGGSEWTLRARV